MVTEEGEEVDEDDEQTLDEEERMEGVTDHQSEVENLQREGKFTG